MPYNNTPIAPSKEVSGQVSLPLARVQKIINADPSRLHTSKNAAFAIALATELFIQHLANTTHNVVKAETQKKPRRNVQYRDVAAAVAKTDNLEFLVDVVPRTQVYREVKARLARKKEEEGKKVGEGEEGGKEGEKGEKGEGENGIQKYMNVGVKKGDGKVEASKEGGDSEGGAEVGAEADAMDVDVEVESLAKEAQRTPVVEVEDSEPEEDGAAMQIEMEMRGPRSPKANNKTPAASPKAPVAGSSKPAPAPVPALAPAPAAAPAPVANHRPTRSSTGGFTAINGK